MFNFTRRVLTKNEIYIYKEKFKTACLNKDMEVLKNLLENYYCILKKKMRCSNEPRNIDDLLASPYCNTIQTPFFIACKKDNESFLKSLVLLEKDSLNFFELSHNSRLFLSFIIQNKQEKAIELFLKYSKFTASNKISINWDDTNNAIIKLLLLYQFNNITLKNAWCFDDLNNNEPLKKIIFDSLQYVTEKNQQLNLYLRAIINKDSEMSNKLTAMYKIDLNSKIYELDTDEDLKTNKITGYQKLLSVYLNIKKQKQNSQYDDVWIFNDIKKAKKNIEGILRNSLNDQEDKLAFISYLNKLCYCKEFNMVEILLDSSGDFLNRQTIFNIVLNPYFKDISITNLLLDNYRVTIPEKNNFKINTCEKNENNQTFFYSFYKKIFNEENIEKLNEINYVKEKIKNKNFINSELQSAAIILFNDKNVYYKAEYKTWPNFDFDCLISYIDFCLDNGGSLTQRDEKKKIPLDYARERYENSFGNIAFSSTQFIIKEKIYHTFLSKTPYIEEKELKFLFFKNGLVLDCIKHIMYYYNFINNERYIAKAVENEKKYYDESWAKKTKFKEEIIKKKNEELKKLLVIGS